MATSSDSEGAARFVGRVPFLMVLTDLAVKGIVFLLLNAGLLRAALNGEHFLSFTALLLRGVIDPAVRMAGKVDSVAALALLFVVCAVGGWILAALDTLFSTVLGWLATVVTYRVRRRRKFKEHERPFFSAPWVLDAHYAALLSFLFSQPKAKAHWEWELFVYYENWGVFTNVFIFTILSVVLMWSNLTFVDTIVLVLLVGFFLANALTHSRAMAQIQLFYQEPLDSLPDTLSR